MPDWPVRAKLGHAIFLAQFDPRFSKRAERRWRMRPNEASTISTSSGSLYLLKTGLDSALGPIFSEFEREILRDRVKAGIAQARSQGKPHGRPITVAAHADEIKALLAQGVSKREIAKRFDISRTSVRRLVA